MRVLYAHGFEGTPENSKSTHMAEVLGWDITAPVMSAKGWNIEQETEVLLELFEGIRHHRRFLNGRSGGRQCQCTAA